MTEIIEIKRFNEIKGLCAGYVACPNPEEAITQFAETYGRCPSTVYVKRMPSGRCSVYIQIGE